MPGDFESFELGNTKYWPANAVIILVSLLMDRLNCLAVKNCYKISTERHLYQSTLVQRISLSKLAFQNTFTFRQFSRVFTAYLKAVNVLKRWKSSTESISRLWLITVPLADSFNWSLVVNLQTTSRISAFFSHYESLKMCKTVKNGRKIETTPET